MSIFDIFKRKNTFYTAKDIQFSGLKGTSKYLTINNKKKIAVAYDKCPTLRAIIDTKADYFTKAKFQVFSNDKVIEKHYITELLKYPHPFYSQKEFLETFAKEINLYSECFIYFNFSTVGSLKSVKSALILRTENVRVIAKKGIDIKEVTKQIDIIDRYEYEFNNKTVYFRPDEILWIVAEPIELIDNELIVKSPVMTAEQPINVIISAYDVRIGLNRKKGGFHILTKEVPKDEIQAFNNQTDEDIAKVQKELSKYDYSIDSYNTLVTTAPLKAQALTFPIATMELNEGIKQAKADLCDVMNFPLQLLNNLDGTTFNNMETASKLVYSQAIIPLWNLFETSVSDYFELSNERLTAVYDDIQELQKDIKTQLEISEKELNIILKLNEAIKTQTITKDIAINYLINMYNIDIELSKLLINEEPTTNILN